jgi:hypothetical protein
LVRVSPPAAVVVVVSEAIAVRDVGWPQAATEAERQSAVRIIMGEKFIRNSFGVSDVDQNEYTESPRRRSPSGNREVRQRAPAKSVWAVSIPAEE